MNYDKYIDTYKDTIKLISFAETLMLIQILIGLVFCQCGMCEYDIKPIILGLVIIVVGAIIIHIINDAKLRIIRLIDAINALKRYKKGITLCDKN